MKFSPIKNKYLNSVAGGALSLALVGAVATQGLVSSPQTALAEAVRVEAPQAPSFADVVEAVSPAVVSVRVEVRMETTGGSGGLRGFDIPDDHPFKRFFEERGGKGFFDRDNRRRFGQRDRKRRKGRRGSSQGSGFFVSEDGYLVTNNHVIRNGKKFTIVMDDGTELEAKLIGSDPKTDLALLKVDEDRKFTYVNFAEKKSRIGDWVVAVGNPFGLGGTVTAGIVSANGRDIGSGPYDDFIQIDAAVNKGNSGGPTFNLNGEVIGVNTAIFSPSGGNVGIAFAVPASTASLIIEDLKDDGSVVRGWLGVQIQPVTKEIAESLDMDDAAGAIVAEAQEKGPAFAAGIKSGDVITAVDGVKIKGPKELARAIAGYAPDTKVKVSVWRNGDQQEIDVDLGKLPGSKQVASLNDDGAIEPTVAEDLGLGLVGSSDGVEVQDVLEDGKAAKKGIRVGDLITSVNGTSVTSPDEVNEAIASAKEDGRSAVLFQVRSERGTRFVALPIDQG